MVADPWVLILTPLLLSTSAAADFAEHRVWAIVARKFAIAASLVLAWMVSVGGAVQLHLYRWMEVGDRHIDIGLFCDGQTAALLVLVAVSSTLSALIGGGQTRAGGAASLVAAGAGLVIIADGNLLALVGLELLLAATFLHAAQSSPTAGAARRVLFYARLAALAFVGTLVFVDTLVVSWLVLLTAAVLVGAWPFHPWLEDLGESGTATGIRLAAALTGVCLLLRFAVPMPALAGVVLLALSCGVQTLSALASQDLFRVQMMTAAAQGSLVLAAVLVDPMVALLLLPLYGATQISSAVAQASIAEALPSVAKRFVDLGGLAPELPWPRGLALAAVFVCSLSAPALWAHTTLANIGFAEAGLPGAALVAILFVLPNLPLARLALLSFAGPVRHQTRSVTLAARLPHWVALTALSLAATIPAAVAWLAGPPTLNVAAAFAAGAGVVVVLAGLLLWRAGPGPTAAVESSLRSFAAHGFGVTRCLQACGVGLEVVGRFLWTALDGVLFGGIPGGMTLGVRAAGWLLARLHDGWSGWAVATALGTIAILLWSMQVGGTSW